MITMPIEDPCPCGGVIERWEFSSDCRGNPPSSGYECSVCHATWETRGEITIKKDRTPSR